MSGVFFLRHTVELQKIVAVKNGGGSVMVVGGKQTRKMCIISVLSTVCLLLCFLNSVELRLYNELYNFCILCVVFKLF